MTVVSVRTREPFGDRSSVFPFFGDINMLVTDAATGREAGHVRGYRGPKDSNSCVCTYVLLVCYKISCLKSHAAFLDSIFCADTLYSDACHAHN